MLKKVLVANRGEIAVRIVRAAREARIESVAVYADPDFDALHVRLADESFALGGVAPTDTYLDIEKMIGIARRSGADAVHPGYGFLSENADFARAVAAAGLVWIGPDPETIELLGDKARARALARRVGAPLAPGTDEPVSEAAQVAEFADVHGLPLVIKAVHGGGGRGMRIVRDRREIPSAFESAAREATAAFGRGECLVERYLERPRHVEAQVLGDRSGRIAVLGTRDCSLQRRNQKLVEEAPAPFLNDVVRDQVHEAAESICRAAGYVGAGTVEFLLGSDGTLTFLEVNARLQVEHPVTEAITGVDLVREQFRIAAGENMSVPDVVPTWGHAIEMRINAEDPALGFLPTPGKLVEFDVPGGAGVRVDSGVERGTTVPASFDSLLAKLIVWGRDREEALERGRRALEEFTIEGIATVLPFHRLALDHPAFTATGTDGFAVHTRWIEDECELSFAPGVLGAHADAGELTRLPIEIDGQRHLVGVPMEFLGGIGSGASSIDDEPEPEQSSADDDGLFSAPFAATVRKWLVSEAAEVGEGQPVVVLEAMKMEVPVRAPRAGTLRRCVEAGAPVDSGAVLGAIEVGS